MVIRKYRTASPSVQIPETGPCCGASVSAVLSLMSSVTRPLLSYFPIKGFCKYSGKLKPDSGLESVQLSFSPSLPPTAAALASPNSPRLQLAAQSFKTW